MATTTWTPELPSTAHPELARLITNLRGELGKLSIATVNLRLQLHEKSPAGVPGATAPLTGTLFDIVADKILNSLVEDEGNVAALEQLEDPLLQRALQRWHKLPYPVWRGLSDRVAQHATSTGANAINAEGGDVDSGEGNRPKKLAELIREEVDEWIIKNERAIRDDMYRSDTPNSGVKTNAGVVRLSEHMGTVLPTSTLTSTARKITRNDEDGFKILDLKRAPYIYIQPSVSAYAQSFETMTNGILRGMDWSNVFVAGGMALGTLLCASSPDSDSPNPNTPEQWKGSDIDVYIYGLAPEAANEKIRHIYDIICSNTPEVSPAGTSS